MFEICWKFCCHIQFSSITHLCPNILNHTISEKIPNNGSEDMELTADGSYSIWNSLNKVEKEWNLQGQSTKRFRGLLFWHGRFSNGVAHFYGSSLAMTFEFSRIFKTNLTSVKYLKRHFLSHPACFFYNRPQVDRWTFCSMCWDIYSAHCNGLELFPELPKIKFVT